MLVICWIITIKLKDFKNEILVSCNTIDISFIENNNSFNENEWKELYKLSEDTFVEETESSKIGAAGAGLTDND